MENIVGIASAVLLALALAAYRYDLKAKTISLPPGPECKLFSGNGHQLPRAEAYRTYKSWSDQLGQSLFAIGFCEHLLTRVRRC